MKQWLLFFILLFTAACTAPCRMANQAEDILVEEFGPRAQFEAYQKFKDLAAALDASQADIDMYQARLDSLEEVPRAERDRLDKQEIQQVRAELIGVRAKYNRMAAEYNAAMAKINYRYANVGMLPEGADEALPREYRIYER